MQLNVSLNWLQHFWFRCACLLQYVISSWPLTADVIRSGDFVTVLKARQIEDQYHPTPMATESRPVLPNLVLRAPKTVHIFPSSLCVVSWTDAKMLTVWGALRTGLGTTGLGHWIISNYWQLILLAVMFLKTFHRTQSEMFKSG